MSIRLQILIVGLLTAILAAGWWSFDIWGGGSAVAKKANRSGVTLVLVEKAKLTDDHISLTLVGTG